MPTANIKLSLLFNAAFLGVSWYICKYVLPKLEQKPKLRLLRLPLLAFRECILFMDINDILNLSLCSKYTTNTIKLFKRSYFKEATNCKVQFIENYGHLDFRVSTSLKRHLHSHKPPLKLPQKLAAQYLELAGCREVEVIIRDRIALEEFASWYNTHESLIKSVYCFENIGRNTTFDLVKKFKNWRRLVLIHGYNEFQFNQTNQNKSISIIRCEQGLLNSFWKLPHQSIHFSANAFKINPFIDYLQRWIASSIPCTELVDFTAEWHLPNYFNTVLFFNILRSVKFEEVNEEWIHPIHGKIPPPSYKIQRRDQKKSALLFTFDKDGELWLGMHIY
ncbi:hypothetical protein CAEBREN_13838 [Caenorhabditis brenneri]|uniref:F-box domain-containing protein n=1 Tax=Caenorhabditis brenneri TaxID=135651 RepID=G0NVN2_CAEBE|nr:hypothetical protein CAEBREN_13838 [Caenorhabditis brenneri]